MAPWRGGSFWLVPDCDTAVCPPGVATTPPDPLGQLWSSMSGRLGHLGLLARRGKKADFQSCWHQDRVSHELQGVLSFNQVKGPVVVTGGEV